MNFVWSDGELVAAEDACVSVFDHGLTVGDGVFETLRVNRGVPFALARHLARLRRSAAGLGMDVPWSDQELRDAAAATVGANGAGPADGVDAARLRITVTTGVGPLGSARGTGRPRVIIAVGPLPAPTGPARVVTVPWRRNEHSAVAGLKTTSYAENVVALDRALRDDAHEAIFANTAGLLCEGTGSNVFVGRGGRLWTPPLGSGCLAGTTRELVLELVPVTEADLPLEALAEADEAFLTSSTREVQPIEAVNGVALPAAPGTLTLQAMESFAALRAADPDP